jgi:hypothetical protein
MGIEGVFPLRKNRSIRDRAGFAAREGKRGERQGRAGTVATAFLATTLATLLVACGGHEDATPAAADCSAAVCELHSVETHKPLPDPPFVMSCSVPCGCDYDTLCAAEPFHGICGL